MPSTSYPQVRSSLTTWRIGTLHVVFTALTRVNREGGGEEEDEDLGAVTVGPAVSPAIGGHLEAACDTIGYLHTRQVVVRKGDKRRKVTRRRLLTGPNERYDTKDRNNAFGAWVDAPDISKMIDTINGVSQEEAT